MLPKTEAVFSPVDFSTDSVRWKLQEREEIDYWKGSRTEIAPIEDREKLQRDKRTQ